MACPKCKCKVTYECNRDGYDDCNDYEMDRYSACGYIFYLMDEADDGPDDYTDLDYDNDCRINRGRG